MRHADALAHLDAQRRRAGAAMRWEQRAVCAAPALALIAFWASAAMAGGLEALGAFPEALLACGFWLAFALAILWGARQWRPITGFAVDRRLAGDSGVEPGVLQALEDQPTRLDPTALALWRASQDRARARAADIKARPARLNLTRVDPYWLRLILPLALIGAAVLGAGAALDRLARGFLPDPGVLSGDGPIAVEAWATPADYTGAEAVSLGDRIGQTVSTPPSVSVTVRVTGPVGAPDLRFEPDAAGARQSVAFTRAGDGAWEAKLALPGPGQLAVVRFHAKARWRIVPAPDAAPTIAFDTPPPVSPTKRLAFSWRAQDDFGVVGVKLRLQPVAPPPGLVGARPIDTPLEQLGGSPKDSQGSADLLLFEHAYAGMEVEARLVAIDALGQEGVSKPERFRLPEKRFSQSAALAAVEIRKLILHERRHYAVGAVIPDLPFAREISDGGMREDNGPNLARAPKAIQRAARMLDAITMEPDAATFAEGGVWAGLRLARNTLARAGTIEETDAAASLLWQVALHAEHGLGADAARALEAARDRLEQALRDGASEDERDQLMEELREAMAAYLQAMVAQAIADGQTPQSAEDTVSQESLEASDLEQMLAEMKRLADAGDLNAAEQLLQQLSQLLGNLSIQLGEGPGLGQSESRGTQAQPGQTPQGLNESLNQQRALREDTARSGEPGGRGRGDQTGEAGESGDGEGGSGGDSAAGLAQRQGALADQIARQRQGSGRGGNQGVNEALEEAERAMRTAEDALREGDMERAEAAQDEALRRLRQGVERAGGQRRASGEAGIEGGPRDPLGRVVGSSGDGEETAVPEEIEQQRAREILDQLRLRAQDPRRPEAEREYLRRLLERFDGS